jgi:pyruvate,water dikinase
MSPVATDQLPALRFDQLGRNDVLIGGGKGASLELARKVENHYGCPQDLEWAISASEPEGENVFLPQSRPETVWTGRDRGSAAGPKGKAFDHVLALFGGGGARPAPGGDGERC